MNLLRLLAVSLLNLPIDKKLSFAHEGFLDSSKLAPLQPQNSTATPKVCDFLGTPSFGFKQLRLLTLRFAKYCLPRISKIAQDSSFLLCLFCCLILLFISGCAEKRPLTVKEFYAEDINDFIKKMQVYNSVEGVLNIQYEAKSSVLNGDASLKISKNELLLRVYYMGFPVGEIYEENGEVSSNLMIEKDRLKQLAIGIRKGFIWWNGDFTITEDTENFILKEKEGQRTVTLKKEGFMPLNQTIIVDNQTVLITYDEYKKIQTEDGTILNMPSNINVYYKNRALKIKIEKIKLSNA